MKLTQKLTRIAALAFGLVPSVLFSLSVSAAEDKAIDIDDLLAKLKKGQYQQSQENQQRETNFVKQKDQQQQLLANAVSDRDT